MTGFLHIMDPTAFLLCHSNLLYKKPLCERSIQMYMGLLFISYTSHFPVLNTEPCITKHNPICLISSTRFSLTFHCMTGWNVQIITWSEVFWENNICLRSSVVTLYFHSRKQHWTTCSDRVHLSPGVMLW